jgi:hypothetical protein
MSQCAIGADGQLLDASEIQFFNDVDDDTPISGPSNLPTPSSWPIHPLFSGIHSPALNVAGSRRTARVSRPSTKVHDPDNAEGSGVAKRKATASSGRRNMRKVVIDTDIESGGDGNTNTDAQSNHTLGAATPDDQNATTEDGESEYPPPIEADDSGDGDSAIAADMAYAQTKAMGDADRLVSQSYSALPLALTYSE